MAYIGNSSLPFDPTRTAAQPRDAERFSGNGSTTNFTLSRVPPNGAIDVTVYVENVAQEPITAYDVVGNSLNFTEAPPTGTYNIYVVYRNTTGSQVIMPDGSVSYNKLANNLRLFTTDNLTPNGNNSVFTLSEPPADANTVFVTVDGMVQRAPVHYTTSGSTITFTSAPPVGSNVHVRHLGFRTSVAVTAIPANTSISQPNIASPTISGSMQFSGTGNRITGDFSNTTVPSRVMFQSGTENGSTAISAIPNGTGQSGYFIGYLGSDPANSSYALLQPLAGEVRISSDKSGTGTYLPMALYTSGLGRVYIDTSGRVTMPYNPKFEVVRNGNTTFTPSNQTEVMIYNQAVVNIGSHYNTTTGLFTAPVAGMYSFFAGAYTPSMAMSQCWFVRNGSRTKSLYTVNTANGTTSGSGLVYLNANDTLGVHFYNGAGGTTDFYANSEHTFFYGTLIG